MKSITARRSALKKRRKEVHDQLRRLRVERTRDPDSPGPESVDRAFEASTHAVLERLENSALAELGRIEHAISHIERGRGNSCECCRKTIDQKRLQAVVHATQCRACARAFRGVLDTQPLDAAPMPPTRDGLDCRHSPVHPILSVVPPATRDHAGVDAPLPL
ncbi:RNA polymerase-binding transcription factor DksA [Panacagrimonas perspica]|uniref:RNA polymerase-binding transcription factor DksA n=1 Tax=Panacagrimonas perspica TaxID=381431 RepID=A0A4R7PC38_9GAMM|nr:TraR/DksA C4-type zinc finger protein [Panacagrimonas perspica]TDU31643.1 RNA polymerase-binding transcription factor DksA [Panacagrimonas perspica]